MSDPTYVALTYDNEAVTGSLDAEFGVFGPFDSYDEASEALERIAATNGLDGEVLTLVKDDGR